MVLIMLKKFNSPFWMCTLLAVAFAGCRHEKPNVIYMPDMVYSPAFKAQKEGSMRMPVQGTIPRDYEPYAYRDNPEAAGRNLKNPLKPTQQVLERGRHVFNTYCMTCHGPAGEGDGSIVPKFPRPPSLQSDKVRGWSDGRIYHVITVGQNLMPSYASQISPGDRWAAIHYVRVVQRAKHPTAEDLKKLNQESK
jgi:mono/diheme cytochrome c family protein